jgi:hypothetical protein
MLTLNDEQLDTVRRCAWPVPPDKRDVYLRRVAGCWKASLIISSSRRPRADVVPVCAGAARVAGLAQPGPPSDPSPPGRCGIGQPRLPARAVATGSEGRGSG